MDERSVQARDIRNSVVVTGDGNAVRLVFGDSGIVLPLRRAQFRPPERRHRREPGPGEPPRELDILVPEAGRLPFLGREDLFAELRAWLEEETDISVHALTGRAGTGKTRLALEFCREVDADPRGGGEGWIAGFVSAGELGAIAEALATRDFAWGARPCW